MRDLDLVGWGKKKLVQMHKTVVLLFTGLTSFPEYAEGIDLPVIIEGSAGCEIGEVDRAGIH
jgi:hypothetical protein